MITTKKLNILTGVQTVTDYPYGRLQCNMSFSIEYVKNKGYRSVMQSVNPKTGRLNAPKKSTYNHFKYMYKEESTGHIKFGGMDIRGFEDIEKFINFVRENEIEFTPEQSQDLYAIIITSIKISFGFTTLKEGITKEEFFDAIKIKELVKLFKDKASINEIKNLDYSYEKIQSLRNLR